MSDRDEDGSPEHQPPDVPPGQYGPPPQGPPPGQYGPPPQGPPAGHGTPPHSQPYPNQPPPDQIGAGAPEIATPGVWHRLDRKVMLLAAARLLVGLAVPLVFVLLGPASGSTMFLGIGATVAMLAAVAAGVWTWYAIRYRFTDQQLQVHTGLVSRKVTTVNLERIRSVDLESTLMHRVLGLAKVEVGTADEAGVSLDALTRANAERLRAYLLRASEDVDEAGEALPSPVTESDQPVAPGDDARSSRRPPQRETELARIDWTWLKYAPFSLSSLAIVAAIAGFGSQYIGNLDLDPERLGVVWTWIDGLSLPMMTLLISVTVLVAWVLLSTANYVISWWNLSLVRQPGGTLKLTRGLFTTRSTTVEESRIRGLQLVEPALLRLVRGAELRVLTTVGVHKVLPPSPRTVDQRVGSIVLEERGPTTMTLRSHGPRARVRQYVQAQVSMLILLGLLAIPTYFFAWSWWIVGGAAAVLIPFGVVTGWQNYRNLGHQLTPEHLVARSGALYRVRSALEREGIIGWEIKQSFFQRRRGLSTLVATTAASPEHIDINDVPLEVAVAVANAATPGVLEEFVDGEVEVDERVRSGWLDLDVG